MPRTSYRVVAVVTSAAILVACTTRDQRIGSDDGRDVCRQQLVALDSTGNFFGEDIVRGAAVGAVGGALIGGLATGRWQGALVGAAVGGAAGAAGGYLAALQRRNAEQGGISAALAGDLQRENSELERTQVAFDQLMDCRFKAAQGVREAYRRGVVPPNVAQAQMADLRNRAQRDIQLAQMINGRIGTRGAEFDTAIENVAPGVKDNVIASRRSRPVVQAAASRAVPLRLRPDSVAVEVGAVQARQAVRVTPAGGGFVRVETEGGQAGYAPADAFASRGGRGVLVPMRGAGLEPAPVSAGGDVRSLAASNIARRENFSESVSTASAAATGGGFELAAS